MLLAAVLVGSGTAAIVWITGGSMVQTTSARLVQCVLLAVFTGGLVLCTALRCDGRATSEIAALHARIANQEARLRDIGDSQGRFVGNIAHEIKTPLTIALAQLDLLVRASHDAIAVRAHGKSIAEEIRHLSDLVESFLRLARPFAQSDTHHHVPVDINDFVMESIRRSQALAFTHDVSIVLTLDSPTEGRGDPQLLGDVMLLGAMLENLVRNAVRFSPRGGKVHVRVEVDDASVRIRVLDRGQGIAANDRESVFDWFFQSPGVTLKSTGTGFGLAIARRVAEHHGGTLELRQSAGQGCEFEVVLPRHHPAPGGGEPARSIEAGA